MACASISSANEMTKSLLIEIPKRFPFTTIWRQNVIRAKTPAGRYVSAGLVGSSDLSGICGDAGGKRIEIEVKFGKDRLSQPQMYFRDMILKAGGIWVCAKSVDQALRDIQLQVDRSQMRWEK